MANIAHMNVTRPARKMAKRIPFPCVAPVAIHTVPVPPTLTFRTPDGVEHTSYAIACEWVTAKAVIAN